MCSHQHLSKLLCCPRQRKSVSFPCPHDARNRDSFKYKIWVRNNRLIRGKTFYTCDEEEAGLRAYNAALGEQERLLGDGIYTETCGRCISRFPRLSSIFISDGVPQAVNLDSRSYANGPTLLQRQHPNVLLTMCFNGEEFESADRHVGIVLRALAIANVRIAELAVEGLKLTRIAFCDFLRRHNHLRQLTLYDVRVTDGQWFNIFKNLREHPELEDLEITHVDDGRLDCPVSTLRASAQRNRSPIFGNRDMASAIVWERECKDPGR
jgi:hypothetical protein